MGGCSSKGRAGIRRRANEEDTVLPRSSPLRSTTPELSASVESPTPYWKPEPRVFLANESEFCVSYWVVQEDKMRTTAHLESIVSSIGLHLNLGNTGGNVTGDLERKTEESTNTEESVYFLMRDHRMAVGGRTQHTHVAFPADCQEVRVYGFFEENGQWRRFKDKVYSIAREQKNFHITAITSNIVPYAKGLPILERNNGEKVRPG